MKSMREKISRFHRTIIVPTPFPSCDMIIIECQFSTERKKQTEESYPAPQLPPATASQKELHGPWGSRWWWLSVYVSCSLPPKPSGPKTLASKTLAGPLQVFKILVTFEWKYLQSGQLNCLLELKSFFSGRLSLMCLWCWPSCNTYRLLTEYHKICLPEVFKDTADWAWEVFFCSKTKDGHILPYSVNNIFITYSDDSLIWAPIIRKSR